jgi:hypothetical protein
MDASIAMLLQQQSERLDTTNAQLAQLATAVAAIQSSLASSQVTAPPPPCSDAQNSARSYCSASQQHEHRHQRARVSDDQIPILARNEVLDTVLSFVGVGEYCYVAGVCRNWRGRYMTSCSQAEHTRPSRFITSVESIVRTAARLQLVLDSGLTIAELVAHTYIFTMAILHRSLEPVAVLSLARVYGMQWNTMHTDLAAEFPGTIELLQWLVRCGCP